jgi:hypothetical protein
MDDIYLPINSTNDFACYVVRDKDTIRAYKTQPAINSSSEFVDFYVNSHYLHKSGTESWGQWENYLPTCLDSNLITTDFEYRTDFADIMIIFFIFAIFIFYLPIKLFSRVLRRVAL